MENPIKMDDLGVPIIVGDGENNGKKNPMNKWDDLVGFTIPSFGLTPILLS